MKGSEWVDIRPTKEEKRAGKDEDGLSGKDLAYGYGVFSFGTTGLLHIEQWDSMGTFALAWDEDPRGSEGPDILAAMQAERDGRRIIPVADLPKGFPWRHFGWIDTDTNRRAIVRMAKGRREAD